MEIETITRKWGNSLAVIIPSNVVAAEKLAEKQEVTVDIQVKRPLRVKDIFGMFKGKITRPTQEIKDEMRAGWMSSSVREEYEPWKRKEKQK